jgi:putative hydrolase of the HAD superfamily
VHGIDPETFLNDVHDIDLSPLQADPVLNRAIARLPGRRFVFTNGCRNHAGRVLDRIGLADLMDDIWDIRTIAFEPKPEPTAYERVLAKAAIAADRAAMFEDVARNLVPAHDLGMTTVWLNNGSVWSKQGPEHPVAESHHIDHETGDLAAFLSAIRI